MLALVACKGEEDPNPDGGPDDVEDPNEESPFTRLTLAGDNALQPISLAVGPGDLVGVAYFFRVSTTDYEIRYIQVDGGQVSQPETVDTVQRVFGLSLAFDSTGRAAVAYLGGGSDNSAFWFQSDLEVSYRNGPNSWTSSVPVTMSEQAVAGNPVSDQGFLVGLNPAMVFHNTTAFVAYRDGHFGQNEVGDWNGSDLESVVGGPTSWTPRVVAAGGNNKQAYGGHIDMVMTASGQPALLHDQVFGTPDGNGANVLFQRRRPDGSWTTALQVQQVANTQRGASLAWDPVLGFGIAVLDRTQNKLTFTECKESATSQCTAAANWTRPDPVYGAGSGGWYPSLAIDPKTHDPSIAYYICSFSAGANEGTCSEKDDELRVATRIEGLWREALVDADGGWSPKLAYLSTGKRVVAYRAPRGGALKLAVEQ
jgi:hypothetical protein